MRWVDDTARTCIGAGVSARQRRAYVAAADAGLVRANDPSAADLDTIDLALGRIKRQQRNLDPDVAGLVQEKLPRLAAE